MDWDCEAFGLVSAAGFFFFVLELLIALSEEEGGKCRRCAIEHFIEFLRLDSEYSTAIEHSPLCLSAM